MGVLELLARVERQSPRLLLEHWRLGCRLRLELLRSGTGVEPEVVLNVRGLAGLEPLEACHGWNSWNAITASGWSSTGGEPCWRLRLRLSEPVLLRLLRFRGLARNELELLF